MTSNRSIKWDFFSGSFLDWHVVQIFHQTKKLTQLHKTNKKKKHTHAGLEVLLCVPHLTHQRTMSSLFGLTGKEGSDTSRAYQRFLAMVLPSLHALHYTLPYHNLGWRESLTLCFVCRKCCCIFLQFLSNPLTHPSCLLVLLLFCCHIMLALIAVHALHSLRCLAMSLNINTMWGVGLAQFYCLQWAHITDLQHIAHCNNIITLPPLFVWGRLHCLLFQPRSYPTVLDIYKEATSELCTLSIHPILLSATGRVLTLPVARTHFPKTRSLVSVWVLLGLILLNWM